MIFRGDYYFLSNMYPASFVYRDFYFPSVEHAYVFMKCAYPEDCVEVLMTDSPFDVKKLGKTVRLKENWDSMKVAIMFEILKEKFSQNQNLRRRLLMIEDDIIEENTWGDTFWGVCDGSGSNHLGNLLMIIRDDLIKGK